MTGSGSDLLTEMEAIEKRARETRQRIETGEAINGISGLADIEKRAGDAIRRHAQNLRDGASR